MTKEEVERVLGERLEQRFVREYGTVLVGDPQKKITVIDYEFSKTHENPGLMPGSICILSFDHTGRRLRFVGTH